MLLVSPDPLAHLDLLSSYHLLLLIRLQREHVLRLVARLLLAHVARGLALVVVGLHEFSLDDSLLLAEEEGQVSMS